MNTFKTCTNTEQICVLWSCQTLCMYTCKYTCMPLVQAVWTGAPRPIRQVRPTQVAVVFTRIDSVIYYLYMNVYENDVICFNLLNCHTFVGWQFDAVFLSLAVCASYLGSCVAWEGLRYAICISVYFYVFSFVFLFQFWR